MGADIHIYVEKKVNGVWDSIDGPNPWKEWNKEHGYSTENESDRVYEGWIYSGRNYSLFSWLADVRNGIRAFLSDEAETGHYVTPLAMPKGLPADVSSHVKDELDDDCDIHSKSYFTFRELIEGAKNATNIKYRNYVSPSEYEEYKKTGSPSGWCGGCNAHMLSNEDMDKYLAGETVVAVKQAVKNWGGKTILHPEERLEVNKETGGFLATLLEWESPMSDSLFSFIDKVMQVSEEYDNLDEIRVVFGFDN